MRKVICILALMLFAAMPVLGAEVTDRVVSTNIGTVIDGAAMRTYHVNDRTFVVAEELRGYGFDVEYNDAERRLTITQNPYAPRTILPKAEVNIDKSSIIENEWRSDVYATDISVYLSGERIEAYAIDGQMVIPIRALEPYAYVDYDDSKRLVTVSALKHYIDQKREAGSPYVTHNVDEYETDVYSKRYSIGGQLSKNSYSTTIKVSEVTDTDTEDGKIEVYSGNPPSEWGSGRWFFKKSYNIESCSVDDINGGYMYMYRKTDWVYAGEEVGTPMTAMNNYLKTASRAQTIMYDADMLYGYRVNYDKEYYNYWPSNDEITAAMAENKRFVAVGNSVHPYMLTESGYLFTLSNASSRNLYRYNIEDSMEQALLSKDNKLYQPQNSLSEPKLSSAFDMVIDTNVRKSNISAFLYTNGELYYFDNYKNSGLDYTTLGKRYKMADNVKDFCGINTYSVLTENGDLYVGNASEFRHGNANIAVTGVSEIYQADDGVMYKSLDGSLHYYSFKNWSPIKLSDDAVSVCGKGKELHFVNSANELWSCDPDNCVPIKKADNISKICESSGQYADRYLTTDGKVTDLSQVYAEDVKDAYMHNLTLYCLKTDDTVFKIDSKGNAEQLYY